MKILQMSKCADPVGGAELYMLLLVEELRKRGHEVFLFGTSPTRAVNEPHERILQRAEYVRDGLFTDEPLEAALAEVLEQFEPDVVHVHNLWGASLGVDRMLAQHSAPLIQTIHDWSTFCPNSWCVLGDGRACVGGAGAKCFANDCGKNYLFDTHSIWATRTREEILSQGVDIALVPSVALCEMARSHRFFDVRHLPYFIDGSRLEPAVSEERVTDRLLFLGRVQPEKGTLFLIEAMPQVLRERPNLRVTFVGDGVQLDEVKARADELGVAGSIDFHSKVPHAEVRRFYAQATALVLPSIWSENSPLTCYESLYVGLPMIGSRIGGIPELVIDGETGLLVNPRDAADLASKVIALCNMSTEERAVFSRNGRAASENLTLEQNVAGVLRAYEDALARGSAAKPEASLPVDDDWLALSAALTSELHGWNDRGEFLERVVREVVDGGWFMELLKPSSMVAGARKVAKKLGLPKIFKG